MLARSAVLWACLGLQLVQHASAGFDWDAFTNQDKLQKGRITYYGHQQGQDSQGTCSFSEEYANTNHLPWTTGTTLTLALNKGDLGGGAGCGMCVMYRGIGGGIGTTPVSTTTWVLGFVNNQCGECAPGDLDQDLAGNGRYDIEWYAVPCNVGNSPLHYNVVMRQHFILAFVVSNHRVPISAVSIYIHNQWYPLVRSANNQWPYHRELGDWEGQFPIRIRVTSVYGETLEDVVSSEAGNAGSSQFRAIPGPPYVSGYIPGYGVPEANTPAFVAPPGANANIGPISGAGAQGAPGNRSYPSITPATAVGTTSDGRTFTGSTLLVANGQQCGGNGGACTARDRGEPVRPCVASAWPMAFCQAPGSACSRVDDSSYVCQPLTAAAAAARSS